MSTNDKTDDQIVESIPRTKAAATKKRAGAASLSRASRRNALKVTEQFSLQAVKSTDPYQACPRIWPD